MVFSNKSKPEKTIINSLKHQKFWNIVEVLKHQKKKNGGNITFQSSNLPSFNENLLTFPWFSFFCLGQWFRVVIDLNG